MVKAMYCKRGHLFTDESTLVMKGGGRACKICRAAYEKAIREKLKAEKQRMKEITAVEMAEFRAWKAMKQAEVQPGAALPSQTDDVAAGALLNEAAKAQKLPAF